MTIIGLTAETHALATAAAAAIDAKKGLDIVALDVSRILVITDVFVIAAGTSRRHVLTLADEVREQLGELGRKPYRTEGRTDGQWVLMDYGDVVVHVFDEETRAYYELERLWADAPRVEWETEHSQA